MRCRMRSLRLPRSGVASLELRAIVACSRGGLAKGCMAARSLSPVACRARSCATELPMAARGMQEGGRGCAQCGAGACVREQACKGVPHRGGAAARLLHGENVMISILGFDKPRAYRQNKSSRDTRKPYVGM